MESKISKLLTKKHKHFPRVLTWFLVSKFELSSKIKITDLINVVNSLELIKTGTHLVPVFLQSVTQTLLPKINESSKFDYQEYLKACNDLKQNLNHELDYGFNDASTIDTLRNLPKITDGLDFSTVKKKLIAIGKKHDIFVYDRLVDVVLEVLGHCLKSSSKVIISGQKRVGKKIVIRLVREYSNFRSTNILSY